MAAWPARAPIGTRQRTCRPRNRRPRLATRRPVRPLAARLGGLLTLKYRFRRSHRRDRVPVAVRHLPVAVLAPKDGRRPDGDRSQLAGSADACPDAFDLNRVRKLRRDDRGNVLELVVPAVAIVARSEVEPIRYLLPAADGRSEWISQCA